MDVSPRRSPKPWWSFRTALYLGLILRLVLILYGHFHDQHSALKYTDVDYRVFSDASKFLVHSKEGETASGPLSKSLALTLGDPYSRATYRYTPLLAVVLLPNEYLHPVWGKVLFVLADLFIGLVLYHLFLPTVIAASPLARTKRANGPSLSKPAEASTDVEPSPDPIKRQATWWIGLVWLLNPMVANISTRGSAESVLGLIVISTLALVLRGRLNAGAVMLGLAVHFKIYPFIYVTSILAMLGDQKHPPWKLWRWLTWKQIKFSLISLGTFLSLGLSMYLIWGQPFIEHTYLYHLSRRDHRHNFSLYFYTSYLSYPSVESRTLIPGNSILSSPLLSFAPQMILCLGSGLLLGRKAKNLPLAFFVQTMLFVNFNKVCTSQYFMWYLWFLPVVLPKIRLSLGKTVLVAVAWIGSQALWLSCAYSLELLGHQIYLPLWVASIVFFISNNYVLLEVIRGYVP